MSPSTGKAMAIEELRQSSECVIYEFDVFQDQAFALAAALVNALTPENEKLPPDGHPIIAWRLAQVLRDHLSSAHCVSVARNLLLGEV